MKYLKTIVSATIVAGTAVALAASPIRGELDLPFLNGRIDQVQQQTNQNTTDIGTIQQQLGVPQSQPTPATQPTSGTTTPTDTAATTVSVAPAQPTPAPTPAVYALSVMQTTTDQADGMTHYVCTWSMSDGGTVTREIGSVPTGGHVTINSPCPANP